MSRYVHHDFIITVILLFFIFNGITSSNELLNNNFIDMQQTRIKYNLTNISNNNSMLLASSDDFSNNESETEFSTEENNYKSPAKAFFLSLAIPGLGQYYNGNRIKSFAFLGVEVTSWVLNIKLNNDGDDITDEFQTFQQTHWSREDYEQKYLLWTYGFTDDEDDTLGIYTELSHHLPDERTQQFYEMTGKYDQFAWGWDDAVYEGNTLDNYSDINPPTRIVSDATTPYTANRLFYEDRRNDANNKYDQARKMVYLALMNRLVSAFEAMFHAKSVNNKSSGSKKNEFSSLKFSAKLKSYHTKRDTPYLTATYKF